MTRRNNSRNRRIRNSVKIGPSSGNTKPQDITFNPGFSIDLNTAQSTPSPI